MSEPKGLFVSEEEMILHFLDAGKGNDDPEFRAHMNFCRTMTSPLMAAITEVADRTDTATAIYSMIWLAELWASMAVGTTLPGCEERALGSVMEIATQRVMSIAKQAAEARKQDAAA